MTDARRALAIPSLDGLRAVSIAFVFLGHIGFDVIPGGFGVTVFFVLSGYLITTLLRLEIDRSKRVSLKHFYVRRMFRIWPAFYAVLLIAAILTLVVGLGSGFVDPLPLAAEGGHIWNYFSIFYSGRETAMAGTGIFWSLAVEEHFYLFLPLVFVIMNRCRLSFKRQAMVLLGLAGVVLVWRVYLVYGVHVSETRTYYATDTRADSLLVGCAMAMFMNPVLDRVPESARMLRNEAVLGVAMILGSLLYRDFEFREGFRYTIQAVAVLLIMRYLIVLPGSLVGRFMNARPVVWVGKLSYPFYLIHYIIVLEIFKHMGVLTNQDRVICAIIAAPVALGLSWVLQRTLMDPATRFRQRRLDQRMAAPQPATPVAA
jgi:peptidoglycan/LPS O-acetylase OafA/YrhL